MLLSEPHDRVGRELRLVSQQLVHLLGHVMSQFCLHTTRMDGKADESLITVFGMDKFCEPADLYVVRQYDVIVRSVRAQVLPRIWWFGMLMRLGNETI